MAHADKRSVSTDALETLGFIHEKEEGRDAIHLAVEPVVAAETLYPGQHVGFVEGGVGTKCQAPVGIVDPFLHGPVYAGQRFWLVVYPRQITSLRHVWTHPAFPGAPEVSGSKAVSEDYLRRFAERLFSYHEPSERFGLLIEGAERGSFGTDIEYNDNCRPTAEFWEHFERYTGRKVTDRPEYFSCSC